MQNDFTVRLYGPNRHRSAEHAFTHMQRGALASLMATNGRAHDDLHHSGVQMASTHAPTSGTGNGGSTSLFSFRPPSHFLSCVFLSPSFLHLSIMLRESL